MFVYIMLNIIILWYINISMGNADMAGNMIGNTLDMFFK